MQRILILVLVLSCSVSTANAADTKDAAVARVNGVAITQRELNQAVNRIIPQETYHATISDEKRQEFQAQALNDLIERELEYQDAVAKGMKADEKSVKEEAEKIRARFKSGKEYKKALDQAGLTEEQLKSRLEKDVLVYEAYKKNVTDAGTMSDEAVRDYYEKNREKFKKPESFRLRIISSRDEIKAKNLLKKVLSGEAFDRVAARESEDNYRIKGGDIGYVHKGRIYPELENEAFKMKVGEIAGPIKAEGQWFIIKLEDKMPEHIIPFDEAKDGLKNDLETEQRAGLKDSWVNSLKKKAEIKILIPLQ